MEAGRAARSACLPYTHMRQGTRELTVWEAHTVSDRLVALARCAEYGQPPAGLAGWHLPSAALPPTLVPVSDSLNALPFGASFIAQIDMTKLGAMAEEDAGKKKKAAAKKGAGGKGQDGGPGKGLGGKDEPFAVLTDEEKNDLVSQEVEMVQAEIEAVGAGRVPQFTEVWMWGRERVRVDRGRVGTCGVARAY